MTRLGWLSGFGVVVLVACSAASEDTAPSKKKSPSSQSDDDDDDSESSDKAEADDDSAGDDDPIVPPSVDASTDAVATDGAAQDAAGSGAECTFNRDCPTAERCECDEATGCFCHVGARGTGQNGVTVCTSSNDCASALCVEGNGGNSYCSDECATAATCGVNLPLCADIALVGKICVRKKV